MKSLNFEFLRSLRPELAALGAFAEAYAHPDPESALVKLRSYAEQVVERVYYDLGLQREPTWNLFELLSEESFESAIPRVVIDKLHLLRKSGNRAAHGKQVDSRLALDRLVDAFDIGRWVHLTFDAGTPGQYPSRFQEPPHGGLAAASKAQLKREKRRALEQLAAREAEMQRLLKDLEEARAEALKAKKSSAELADLLELGRSRATELALDEEATRHRLIDEQLVAAGWDLSPGSEEVSREHEVLHQPTSSGRGRADYVLVDDDARPLAVIEAKRTAKNASSGQTRAREYADGLERMYGRRPVIFYTNGYEIWLWDDAQGFPPRRAAGFYSKDSLQYLFHQRRERLEFGEYVAQPRMDLRLYQTEAVSRVMERFQSKKRRALVVMATGTGKTRVAVALADLLHAYRWAKRVLFLCDRRELRKQAYSAFKELLPHQPITVVNRSTAQDRDKRIYLATYPAMMKCLEGFDVGFFDLIVADESHRSIYRHYREIFRYFDAMQVGLTATPRKGLIDRNTYRMFDCEDEDPTAFFGFDEAVNHVPPWLVPFEVEEFTTEFLRRGIYYKELSREQQLELELGEERPELVGFAPGDIDRIVFNKDTNRRILRNLMDRGIRVGDGTRLGKTIIFARNHRHAMLMHELFDEMYPQFGGDFCRVIDSHDVRAEQLIDDFKGKGNNPDLTIAISVDMLDTGIDVPEIVNLVFAKPVFSYIKFWQMIGRGTRLCPDLFGPGQDKERFLIFDHWGNFDRFGEEYKERRERPMAPSLLEQLFVARLDLARLALERGDETAFEAAIELIAQDLQALPESSVAVRPKWREIRHVSRPEVLRALDAKTEAELRRDLAPLMRWRSVKNLEAIRFDLLMARAQIAQLKGSSELADWRDQVADLLAQLPANLHQVRAKAELIVRVGRADFWDEAGFADLEEARRELRGLLRYRLVLAGVPPKMLDVTEDALKIRRRRYVPKLEGLELVAYRMRVKDALEALFEESPVLRKIHAGEPVASEDLVALRDLVLDQHPDLDLEDLKVHFPDLADHLDVAIRGIIGLDAAAVDRRFKAFVEAHPALSARQIQFLELLKAQIARYGSIELERLYETPFTTLHHDGLDGLFPEEADELLRVVSTFIPTSSY